MEDTIDEAAAQLAFNLLDLIEKDWLPDRTLLDPDRYQVGEPSEPEPEARYRPPCERVTDLDWLTYDKGGVAHKINHAVAKSNPHWFRRQLAYCSTCQIQPECEGRAVRYGIDFGIWGGKLPHERRDTE